MLFLLITFLLVLVYQLRFLRLVTSPIREKEGKPEDCPPVSVLLYVDDCNDTLPEMLRALSDQDYPAFEVIVVNNDRDKDTEALLNHFAAEHRNFYHTYIPRDARYLSRKKLALTLAVKAAHYDHFLLLETDCLPTSRHWIHAMMQSYREQTEIVLGYHHRTEELVFECHPVNHIFYFLVNLFACLAKVVCPSFGKVVGQ